MKRQVIYLKKLLANSIVFWIIVIDKDLKNRLEKDKAYLMALKYEAQAQATLYKGELEKAIELFNEASRYYNLSDDSNSSLWTQGYALALESLLRRLKVICKSL